MKPCKALLAGAAVTGCLAAGAAWSQDRGAYVGGSLGRAEMKDACEGVSVSCDKTDKAWKIFGGYQFNRNLAAELGYTDLGETKASGVQGGVAVNGNVSSKAWELVAVGSMPLMREVSLYAKLGIYHGTTDSNASAAVPGFATSGSASGSNTDFTVGFGAQVAILRNLAARAEWQKYNDVGTNNTGKTDVDVLSAAVIYRF
jgi:OOP family OmpA-OmpF porin